MAVTLWGNVHHDNRHAGILQQEPGGRCVFTYDAAYIETGGPAIANTLPLQEAPYLSEGGLHPFFDNLVAEGWLKTAQVRALGVRPETGIGSTPLRDGLIDLMEKRWNGTFASTGQLLSKRRSGGGKRKGLRSNAWSPSPT